MVQIKEEAFDEEGYFNPGWKEQFIGVSEPAPGNKVDQYLFRDGEVLFPPAVLWHGFEVMQDKFLSFAGEFSQLMNSMSNMSQSNEVMNVEIFSALSRNVGKLREMKKAHEDMATEITVLKLENSELCHALAEAKEALADTGNAQILRAENQELYQENRELKSDLESAQRLLFGLLHPCQTRWSCQHLPSSC